MSGWRDFHDDDPTQVHQAERALHPLGHGHTAWLCTESSPKNGQGSHAVRRAGLIMVLFLANGSMDHTAAVLTDLSPGILLPPILRCLRLLASASES